MKKNATGWGFLALDRHHIGMAVLIWGLCDSNMVWHFSLYVTGVRVTLCHTCYGFCLRVHQVQIALQPKKDSWHGDAYKVQVFYAVIFLGQIKKGVQRSQFKFFKPIDGIIVPFLLDPFQDGGKCVHGLYSPLIIAIAAYPVPQMVTH